MSFQHTLLGPDLDPLNTRHSCPSTMSICNSLPELSLAARTMHGAGSMYKAVCALGTTLSHDGEGLQGQDPTSTLRMGQLSAVLYSSPQKPPARVSPSAHRGNLLTSTSSWHPSLPGLTSPFHEWCFTLIDLLGTGGNSFSLTAWRGWHSAPFPSLLCWRGLVK